MSVLHYFPSHPLLKKIVVHYSVHQKQENQAVQTIILPDGTSNLIFLFDSSFEILSGNQVTICKNFSLAGISDTATTMKFNPGELEGICVKLKPGGLYMLTGKEMDPFSNQHISADEIFHSDTLASLQFHLYGKPASEQIALIESFLCRHLKFSLDPRIDFFIKQIHQNPADIATIAQKVGLSDRQMRKLFQRYIGLSPKRFQIIHRFYNVAQDLQKSGELLTSIAYKFNYADQSHFIKSIKSLSGMSPKKLAKKQSSSDLYNF
jgi:AraC-like DNA-binding protein